MDNDLRAIGMNVWCGANLYSSLWISRWQHLRFLGGPKYPGEQAGRSSSNACDKISFEFGSTVSSIPTQCIYPSLHASLLVAMMPGHQGEDDASKMHCCFAEVDEINLVGCKHAPCTVLSLSVLVFLKAGRKGYKLIQVTIVSQISQISINF